MADDQGYYNNQSQRPYNGGAGRRPGPPQGGYAPQPAQRYPPQQQQQYDQYAQDDYRYDDYYGQDQGYDQGYGGGGGRGNGYPPQQGRGYPPPQQQQDDYHGGGQGQRGGMPPPRGGRGGLPPLQRPPTANGGYDERGGGRGYPNGGPVGKGGRPTLDRNPSSNPSMRSQDQLPPRKPLISPKKSPDVVTTWDNPFPTFPGAKKKTSISEEKAILDKMEGMNIGQPSNRPRTAGSKGSGGRGASIDEYARPSIDSQRRGAPQDDNHRPGSNQRNMPPINYPPQGPPQQGYQEPRRGPPGPGYGPPARQNTYDQGYNDRSYDQPPPRENFGPPARSMTMPNEPPMPMGRKPPMPTMHDIGTSAPYNGPVARGMPPRPNTASGNSPPPQRSYPPDPYANGGGQAPQNQHARGASVSDLYDDYFGGDAPLERKTTNESEFPNFDTIPAVEKQQRRGNSIDEHIISPTQNGYGQLVTRQPDARSQIQAHSATFEMAGEIPAMPNGYDQGYRDDGYGNNYNQGPVRGASGRDYYEPPRAPGFQPPARTASAGPAFGGNPNGQSLSGMPPRQPPLTGGLPSHPPPIRAGLIPNSVAAQANNKPPPVRNYNGIAPPAQPAPSPVSAPTSSKSAAAAPTPVTEAELNQLRNTIRINPNDLASQMLLARRLVEASEVLVSSIPDQRARAKAREKYVMDAHKILKKLVAAQYSEAMFYLADCYGRGALGLAADNKEAFSLYQSAAKAGHAAAAYRTAVCCELGNEEGGGTRKDPLKAIQWYKRAAMLGDTPAMYKMGIVQLKGLLGQPRNPREAVGWLKRAADRADAENPHALHELALLYEQPQSGDSSVVRDEVYSFELFKQAADLGYKFSQFRLGCAFEYGLFQCPIDPRQSIMWYSRAAAQEEHQSELALSGWYLTGSEGVLQQSDTEAYLWARKAAMSGLAKAEYAMGYFTEVGIGAPSDIEGAKRWYWRAAAQNFPKARERLEDLKRGGGKSRERISRSKVGKQNEGECVLM